MSLPGVRFRSHQPLTFRDDLIESAESWIGAYSRVEIETGNQIDYKLGELASGLRSGAVDPVGAAALAREAMGLGPSDFVSDICGLLEKNGIKVLTLPIEYDGFFGFSMAAGGHGPAMMVNCWKGAPVERWISTAAHELGHLFLHPDSYDVNVLDEDEEQAREANVFATHFLMPDALFDAQWEAARGSALVDRVFKVKRDFGVSWKTVVFRVASRSHDKSVWTQMNAAYKRRTQLSLRGTDEPEPLRRAAFGPHAPAATIASDDSEYLASADFLGGRLLALVRTSIEAGELSLERASVLLGVDLETLRKLQGKVN